MIGSYNKLYNSTSSNFVAWNGTTFVSGDHNRIIVHQVQFDRRLLENTMQSKIIQLPASGLDRDFTNACFVNNQCFCSTNNGELC